MTWRHPRLVDDDSRHFICFDARVDDVSFSRFNRRTGFTEYRATLRHPSFWPSQDEGFLAAAGLHDDGRTVRVGDDRCYTPKFDPAVRRLDGTEVILVCSGVKDRLQIAVERPEP